MQDISRQTYQGYGMTIQAEYEEEKRVFTLMKRCFLIFGGLLAAVVLIILLFNLPALVAKTGVGYLPVDILVIAYGTVMIGLWGGVIPSGYIGMWRALRRSRFFVFGNPIAMVLILTFLALIPAMLAPIFFFCQWRKVANLKHQLDRIA